MRPVAVHVSHWGSAPSTRPVWALPRRKPQVAVLEEDSRERGSLTSFTPTRVVRLLRIMNVRHDAYPSIVRTPCTPQAGGAAIDSRAVPAEVVPMFSLAYRCVSCTSWRYVARCGYERCVSVLRRTRSLMIERAVTFWYSPLSRFRRLSFTRQAFMIRWYYAAPEWGHHAVETFLHVRGGVRGVMRPMRVF